MRNTSLVRPIHLVCPPLAAVALLGSLAVPAAAKPQIGREVAIQSHMADGEEFQVDIRRLIQHGRRLFAASWTEQEGGGRPLTKGTGGPLADPSSPLEFPRNMNRVSAPDSNACSGCHNAPFGVPGGGGDFVTNVFVLGQRFDFATFDMSDPTPTRGAMDESGTPVELQTIANSRATIGMFGSGYIEMLTRQMTAELQALRDGLAPGGSVALLTKGVSFGTLSRAGDGSWDTSAVEGLSPGSLASSGPASPPSLLIKPFHQAGAVVSLRQFSNGAYNHHHGIQTRERFGPGDPDGDGYTDELTVADVTAVSVYQAALAVPGRVIPRDDAVEAAVERGEDVFVSIGCVDCHVPYLELSDDGWIFTEPNPYNSAADLRPGDPYVQTFGTFSFDLNDQRLPRPRLRRETPHGGVRVPAFTDLKLHDITSGPGDPNREVLNMQFPAGSPEFFAGNAQFLTKKLWGCANEPPYFHHGLFNTMRQAVEAHAGEAQAQRDAWEALSDDDKDAVIEFLKTLQVLPPDTHALILDEKGHPRTWRPFPWSPR